MNIKRIIPIIFLTLFMMPSFLLAQFKVEDITKSLHLTTLKSFDDERITTFLETFAEDLKDYSWEKVRPHCYDKHVTFQTGLICSY